MCFLFNVFTFFFNFNQITFNNVTIRIDIDINDNNSLHFNAKARGNEFNAVQQAQQHMKSANAMNGGIGHKVAAGLMLPSSTVKSYAAIASQAAAAAAVQQRNIETSNNSNSNINNNNNNLLFGHNKSYNNPGFFESATSYQSMIVN